VLKGGIQVRSADTKNQSKPADSAKAGEVQKSLSATASA
jgi:hypothetical protein